MNHLKMFRIVLLVLVLGAGSTAFAQTKEEKAEQKAAEKAAKEEKKKAEADKKAFDKAAKEDAKAEAAIAEADENAGGGDKASTSWGVPFDGASIQMPDPCWKPGHGILNVLL